MKRQKRMQVTAHRTLRAPPPYQVETNECERLTIKLGGDEYEIRATDSGELQLRCNLVRNGGLATTLVMTPRSSNVINLKAR